jgi:hypothetical protein
VQVTINTRSQEYAAADEMRLPFIPEDGENAITVRVGEEWPVQIFCEKWSGHHLFPRYGSSRVLPSPEELQERFATAHARQERGYRGGGIWTTSIAREAEEQEPPRGKEGLDHNCAFPMEAYALACLYLERDEIYEQRVREACERMLREEQPGGYFFNYHHGAQSRPFLGGAFTQGSIGEALLLGYRVLGDERCLEASRRAAKAYDEYSLESNVNYMAFLLWHVAELYELTGDEYELERSVWYARHAIIRGMNPSGAYPGHNYYTSYGDIILKGLAKLLRVLPREHEFYPTLRERTLRYTNQMLSRQCADGSFEGRNRLYFGYRHSCNGLFEVLRALPEYAAELEPVVIHMLNAKSRDPVLGDLAGIKELALMARYVKERQMKRLV